MEDPKDKSLTQELSQSGNADGPGKFWHTELYSGETERAVSQAGRRTGVLSSGVLREPTTGEGKTRQGVATETKRTAGTIFRAFFRELGSVRKVDPRTGGRQQMLPNPSHARNLGVILP